MCTFVSKNRPYNDQRKQTPKDQWFTKHYPHKQIIVLHELHWNHGLTRVLAVNKSCSTATVVKNPVVMCMPFDFLAHRLLNYLAFSVPDEGYSRNASCELSLISTFLLKGFQTHTQERRVIVQLVACRRFPPPIDLVVTA
jgi:hypothetical protein